MPISSSPAAACTGPSVPSQPTACPSDIDLACFVDGRLDESAHQAMLRHLDECDDCRDVVATAVEALPTDPQPAADPGASDATAADVPQAS